jgi:UDP-glucose 4-epimerase
MKILITGGAGFIGSNLAKFLNKFSPDYQITVLDDLSNGKLSNLDQLDLEFHKGSILDWEILQRVASGAEVIVHLAALGSVPRSVAAPRPTHEANITGTLNVLEAARALNISQVISASSSSVYGGNPILPKPELTWTRPMSPYAVSKLATEAYTNAYRTSYGINTLAFRFFNVYGPNQPADHIYAAVIPKFVEATLTGKTLEIHGDGTQSRDFTFVDTVCEAILEAIQQKMSHPHPVNLAFGTKTNLLDLIKIIGEETSIHPQISFTEPRIGDVPASQADPTQFKELFPRLSPVPLKAGIEKTVKWFLEKQ